MELGKKTWKHTSVYGINETSPSNNSMCVYRKRIAQFAVEEGALQFMMKKYFTRSYFFRFLGLRRLENMVRKKKDLNILICK